MSTVTLTKWGNSVGIRIPALILKEAHLMPGDALQIKADEKGVLTLIAIKNQQEGWTEQFNVIADSKNETLYLDIENDFDADEWTW